jgi:Sec-independent protein secretion pathway component TatC
MFLMLAGALVAYITMFFAVGWFLGYLNNFPQPAILMQDPNDYILFLLKMMAAFAIAFQLPVVLMALAYAGLVTSKGLITQWKWGLVIACLGMVFTPANDPWSLALIAVALLILYFGSILLVKYIERTRATVHGRERWSLNVAQGKYPYTGKRKNRERVYALRLFLVLAFISALTWASWFSPYAKTMSHRDPTVSIAP